MLGRGTVVTLTATVTIDRGRGMHAVSTSILYTKITYEFHIFTWIKNYRQNRLHPRMRDLIAMRSCNYWNPSEVTLVMEQSQSTSTLHCVQKKTPTHIFFHISMNYLWIETKIAVNIPKD